MSHAKDRPGLTRGQLLRGAAAAAVGVGAAGGLAACQNTTTPIGACEDGDGAGGLAAKLVEPKPVGPGGLPLPRNDSTVTWAITDDNPLLPEGRRPERGTLRLFNYADYIWPGLVKRFERKYDCKVTIATYNSADEAAAKLLAGRVTFDVVLGLSATEIVKLMAGEVLKPLNHAYLPNLAKNVWPELQDPFYDRGSRYTPSRTSSGRTGSAGGTTSCVRTSARWTFRGTSSGSRVPTGARSACSTTSGTG